MIINLLTREMFAEFARRLPGVTLLADMTEFGRTRFTAAEREALGSRTVIAPVSSLRLANEAKAALYAASRRHGGTRTMPSTGKRATSLPAPLSDP